EKVLVIGPLPVRLNQMPKVYFRVVPFLFLLALHPLYVHPASQQHLHLQGSVLVEDPVEAIIVFIDPDEGSKHELPSVSDIAAMTPEDAAVTLVNGHGVRHLDGPSLAIMQPGTELTGVSRSIPPRIKGCFRVNAHAVLSRVEWTP